MDMDYQSDIAIDEDALDVEWLRQPQLVIFYNRHSAHCKRLVDQAKTKIEIVKAELDKKIRKNPAKYGLYKVTNETVFNCILLQPRYQEAQYEYIDKKYDADIAQAAVWALNDKKAALENLVRLYGQNYFAGPSVPRDLSSEWVKSEKTKNLHKKMQRKLSETK